MLIDPQESDKYVAIALMPRRRMLALLFVLVAFVAGMVCLESYAEWRCSVFNAVP